MADNLSSSINSKFLASNIEAPSILNEIHVYYDNSIERLTKQIIKVNQVYRQQNLVKYIKDVIKLPYEFELVSNGEILTPVSELFSPKGILKVDVFCKYIRNVNKEGEALQGVELNAFFKQRKIDLQGDIMNANDFEKCIAILKCSFDFDPKQLLSFKKEIWHTVQCNEASKSSLIKRILVFAVEEDPFLRVMEQYPINDQKHFVKADHAVVQMFSERPLLICEDKYSQRDLYESLIQNFDQAKTYSLTAEGKQFPLIYGVISNFNEWRICCYYPPKPGTLDSRRNFYVSKVFKLLNKDFDPQDAQEAFAELDSKLKDLIGLIKGVLKKDVDITVAKTYFF